MAVHVHGRAQDPYYSYILFRVPTTTHCLPSFPPDHAARSGPEWPVPHGCADLGSRQCRGQSRLERGHPGPLHDQEEQQQPTLSVLCEPKKARSQRGGGPGGRQRRRTGASAPHQPPGLLSGSQRPSVLHPLSRAAGGHPLRAVPVGPFAQVLLPLLQTKHQTAGSQRRGLLSQWRKMPSRGLQRPLGLYARGDRDHPCRRRESEERERLVTFRFQKNPVIALN